MFPELSFTVFNNSDAPIQVTDISITGTDAGRFVLQTTTAFYMRPHSSACIPVHFDDRLLTEAKVYTAQAVVTFSDSSTQTVDLTIDKSGSELFPEMLINGDFSDGTNNWTPTSTATLSIENGIDGEDGVLAVNDAGGWSACKQIVDVEPNTDYICCGYRNGQGNASNGVLNIYSGAITGDLSANGDLVAEYCEETTWEYFAFRFNTGDNTQVTYTLHSSSTYSSYWKFVSLKKDYIGEHKILAHRGFADCAPENTLAAYEYAYQSGCKYIEMDVQISKDGIPVIIHDTTVDRTTDGTGNVRDLTVAELQALDAGSHYDADYTGEKIPTFEDVLQWADAKNDPNLILVPETKDYRYPSDIRLMAEINAKYPNVRVIWQSFWFDRINTIKALYPDGALGYFISASTNSYGYGEGLSTLLSTAEKYNMAPGTPENLHQQIAKSAIKANKHAVWTLSDQASVDEAKKRCVKYSYCNANYITIPKQLQSDGVYISFGAASNCSAFTANVLTDPSDTTTVFSLVDSTNTDSGLTLQQLNAWDATGDTVGQTVRDGLVPGCLTENGWVIKSDGTGYVELKIDGLDSASTYKIVVVGNAPNGDVGRAFRIKTDINKATRYDSYSDYPTGAVFGGITGVTNTTVRIESLDDGNGSGKFYPIISAMAILKA